MCPIERTKRRTHLPLRTHAHLPAFPRLFLGEKRQLNGPACQIIEYIQSPIKYEYNIIYTAVATTSTFSRVSLVSLRGPSTGSRPLPSIDRLRRTENARGPQLSAMGVTRFILKFWALAAGGARPKCKRIPQLMYSCMGRAPEAMCLWVSCRYPLHRECLMYMQYIVHSAGGWNETLERLSQESPKQKGCKVNVCNHSEYY